MRLRAALVGLALLLATDAHADVASVVQDCSDRLQGQPVGLPALEANCPALPGALQAAGIRPLLIDSSRALLSRASLNQLPGLVRPASGPAPAVTTLRPILRELQAVPAPTRTWWERALDWLDKHFGRTQQADTRPWLTGILKLLPRLQWLWNTIIWITVLALPIAVVFIVRREMRAMGRRSNDARRQLERAGAVGLTESRLAQLRRVPPPQRPAQLFAMLISRLVAAGRLPPDRSLTHREVVGRAVLDDMEQRRLIESLAHLSELQLYAQMPAAPAELDELIARGEDLFVIGWAPRSLG